MYQSTKKIFFSFATVATEDPEVHEAILDYEDHFFHVGPPESLRKYEPCALELSEQVATLINCAPDEVTFTKNTSDGIIIATEALPLNAGDEVLVLENEYRANLVPWLKKRKDGIQVRIIEGHDNVKATEALIAAVGERTKAIGISWIQYSDGYITDLECISRLCVERGIYLVLDAVQGVGVRKLDLQKTPVSLATCGGQKYLRAGPGTGFLYVNHEIMPQLRDVHVGIRSVVQADRNGYILSEGAARFQDGTMNIEGIVALLAAVKHLNREGMENIERRNLELLHTFKRCLTDNGIKYVDHQDRQGNIITLQIDGAESLVKYLEDKHIYIRYLRDINAARISFHYTSTVEDFRELVKGIREWLDLRAQAKNLDRERIVA